jgi:CubicO group peptidase (beta-lactamase class C family)
MLTTYSGVTLMLIHHFPRTSPERQGIASAALLQFVEALDSQMHELHSFMLLRHGSVVAEGWWAPYRPEYPHMLFSLSKSFTSTAVGLAVAEGHFSIDDLVLSFFPDEAPAQASDFLAAMRVRHLLSMSTGHAEDTWGSMIHRPDGNWIKGFLGVPVLHAPGTHFLYNTGATYMLAAIVQKTTGTRLIDYLEPRLFEPLGIQHATWEESPQGIATGGIGLSLTTEEIARFGQFYLQKGIWQGRRLLSEAWIAEATTTQMSNGANSQSDWTQGYGYQFWRCRHGAYRGDGVFGQYCIVMPEQDAVLAITGGIDVFDAQQPLDLVWDILLPAMSNEPPAEDRASQHRLTEKLSSLALLPVQGRAPSPIASQVSGRTYRIDGNELKLETIALHVSGSGWRVSIKTAAGEETIPCGSGVWQHGQTTLFNDPRLHGPTPVVASGAWTAEDSFTMVVRLYETPFFHTLVYHFVGNEMIVELRVNVSLEFTKPLLLTAHLI